VRRISFFILWLFGWKSPDRTPEGIDKAVLAVAPHTSNWDFPLGRLYAWTAGLPVRFLIKKELYFWPLGWVLDKIGGVPVDRKKGKNTVDVVASLFNDYERLYIAITPEGTRKLTTEWKKGFYFIALKAKVPILLSYIDYEKKIVGMGKPFEVTGDYEADMAKIKEFYKTKGAKYPEMYSLSPENLKTDK
jgi:1-acyl-sn-glycerol-3-phosphate acyltransferase